MIYDKKCPVCGKIGSGIIFFSIHWADCGVDSDDMTIIEDIEYEQVNLLESKNE